MSREDEKPVEARIRAKDRLGLNIRGGFTDCTANFNLLSCSIFDKLSSIRSLVYNYTVNKIQEIELEKEGKCRPGEMRRRRAENTRKLLTLPLSTFSRSKRVCVCEREREGGSCA